MGLLEIFITFLKIGAMAFGGGYTIIAIVQEAISKRKRWLSESEVMDYMAISQSLPGIISINFAAFVGYRRSGFLGSIAAVLGVISAPMCVVLALVHLVRRLNEFPILSSALFGIQISVCAFLLWAAVRFFQASVRSMMAELIWVLTAGLFLYTHCSPVWLFIGAGVIGYVHYRHRIKEDAK